MPTGLPVTLTNGTVPEAKRPVTDPTVEYLAGGARGLGSTTGPKVLPPDFDDVCRQHGTMQVYEWMLCDSAVASALNKIAQGVLAGGVKLRPTKEAAPGGKPDPDAKKAREITDWCQVNLDRLDVPLPDVLEEWLDALAFGSVLSEVVWDEELVEGKRVLKAIKPKPWWSYRYVIDRFGEILWIEQVDRYTGKPAAPEGRIGRDHVAVFTWAGRRGDPRGQSLLRPAYLPWSDKRQAKIDYLKYLKRFASPSVAVTLPENPQPVTGDNGEPVNLYRWVGEKLEAFVNGYWVVLPAGSIIQLLQASGNGEAFLNGTRDYNSDIATTILGSARSTMEAEHGSRADSETSQDDVGGLTRFVGGKLSRCLQWDVLYPIVVENWGKEVADAFTPLVDVGAVEHQDEAVLAGAYGPIGYKLHSKHLPAIDAKLGLEPRTEEDIAEEEAKAQEAMQQQMEMKQAAVPAPPGGGGKAPAKADGKAKPKPAQFAFEDYSAIPGPWHDADVIAARGLLARVLGPKFARWQKGTIDTGDLLGALEGLCVAAEARLREDAGPLASRRDEESPSPMAEFALGFGFVRDWADGAARFLRQSYLAGSLLLMGPEELTAADWLALNEANREQVDYLDGFASDLMSAKPMSSAQVVARAGSYGDSVWLVSQAVNHAHAISEGKTQVRSLLGASEEPCRGAPDADGRPSCVAEKNRGWQPIGAVSLPGKRKCKKGCKCHLEFRGGPA